MDPSSSLSPSIDQSICLTAPVVGNVSVGSSWERRKQTICMFSCSLYFILPMVVACWGTTFYFVYKSRWTAALVLAYLSFALILDKSPITGSRTPWLRRMRRWWAHSCDFLPLLLVKTSPLDPRKRYVLGYHPHGIISVGCFGAFATDSAKTLSLVTGDKSRAGDRGFSSLFPDIDRRILTLPQNFNTPFLREYFLSMGACTSDKATFRNVLSKDQQGMALVVVVGGAQESMHARCGKYDLVLSHRRGFVREAIMANASLVPVIGFGETDLYETIETEKSSWVFAFQRFVKSSTGFATPIFKGRSIFFRDFGIMPQRKPVVVVVGAPIAPPPNLTADRRTKFDPLIDRQTDKPLNDDGALVMEWHAKYIKALEELYTTHKDQRWNLPGMSRRTSLQIVQ